MQTVRVTRTRSRRQLEAIGLGVGGTGLVTAVFYAIGSHVPVTIPALLLLVPIVAASVLGGVVVAVPVAVLAAAAYALAFLPPIGHVRIGLTEDVFVLITFVAVALAVAILSGRRSRGSADALIDDRRAQLLRSVSHDLRNPLSTIRSVSTDLLEQGSYDAPTRNALLGVVVDESERLDRIVGNLLSLTRIQAGSLSPELDDESISTLIDRCVQRFERLPDNGEVDVVARIEPDLPNVRVDPVQIDQVLTNLIENAKRAAPVGTTVTVEARLHIAGFVAVSVRDRGNGFAVDDLDTVFEAFHSTSGSSGLGLAVCKAIVEAHGGTINASTSPDGGGRVTFTVLTTAR